MPQQTATHKVLQCSHCGNFCADDEYSLNGKVFCCTGCKTVYEMLNEKNLSNYYELVERPGISFKDIEQKRFDYLDDKTVIKKILDYSDDLLSIATFYIPQIHCSSCIWLLENLFKLHEGINQSAVNFLTKKVEVRFNHNLISLKNLVSLLASVGYEPEINLDSIEQKKKSHDKKLYYKLGVAGFCFGNIMLLSFPEYLSIGLNDTYFKHIFAVLNLILALPVFFYSASDFFSSAYHGLRSKIVNIDFPIGLGILTLFVRSAYEVLTKSGPGYFDSLSGLVFFLLLGKLFQKKTYDSLNFERNYKSYFPLSVIVKKEDKEDSIPVSSLKVGDRIVIRKNEIIPADSILFYGEGLIDFSFVTGESKPVNKVMGELVYAGGRQLGGAIELEIVKEVSQSYLTELWNSSNFGNKTISRFNGFINKVSKYFTSVVLIIAFLSGLYWLFRNPSIGLNAFTAVLIVACPCALALSVPFTLGSILRIFGKNKFYLKNTGVIENLSDVDSIVFDKTGTITEMNKAEIDFVGEKLDIFQSEVIKSVVKNSVHPASKVIYNNLTNYKCYEVVKFKEHAGKGVEGYVNGHFVKLGNLNFISENKSAETNEIIDDNYGSRVYAAIDNSLIGFFKLSNYYREGISKLINELESEYLLSILSGDSEGEKENLERMLRKGAEIRFKQSVHDKLNFVEELQEEGKKVLMIGDGLNDAGALGKSDVGIAVTENVSYFSPACDAIVDASVLKKLKTFLDFSKDGKRIIYISFGISFLYNLVGLAFAVGGMLSPIVAAILMPLSSISVVAFATTAANFAAKKRGL